MSYNKIRNEKQISEKRAVFGAAGAFSDALKSEQTESFGGGCFFSERASVPEDGFRIALNMQSEGVSLKTRNEHKARPITSAKRYIPLNDMLCGMGADAFRAIGNASVSESDGVFSMACVFSAEADGENEETGAYFTAKLAPGKYLFRLYMGEGVCPHIRLYENISAPYLDGKPEVLLDPDGKRYVQAEFETTGFIRAELIYEPNGKVEEVHTFGRVMMLDIGAACALGMPTEAAKNMFFEGEMGIYTGVFPVEEGEADAEAFAAGIYAFKKGNSFYCGKAAGGEFFLEASDMPEGEKCVIYRSSEGFIAVCENGYMLLTDDNSPCIGARKSRLCEPMHYHLYDPAEETKSKKTAELNMFSEYFYVKLLTKTATYGELPEGLLVDADFCEAYAHEDGSLLPEGSVTLEAYENGGGRLSIHSNHYAQEVKLRVRRGSELSEKIRKCRELLFSPEESETFPSLLGKGNNVILYGGKNASLFAVAPLNENMCAAESEVLLAENTEKITSVLRYSENFLVFSPHYIRKMVVTESEGGGFTHTMENFKYDVGCDIPKSAVCADDKIIYANSRAGVFYINRFGFTERDMSRHVSANIESGENGLLSHAESDLAAAEAAVCGGKYFLRVGEFFYVWDFAKALPTGNEKASEERKLKWFIYSGLPCRRLLGADETKLYFSAEEFGFSELAAGTSLSSGAESYFRSREYALAPFGTASVWRLCVSLSAKESCTLRLYFDGEEGSSRYVLAPEKEQSTLCFIRPEARKCRSFAFSLHSFGAVRLDGIKIEYLTQ